MLCLIRLSCREGYVWSCSRHSVPVFDVMPLDPYQQFVALFFLGFGLILAAVLNLSLRRASLARRIGATAFAGAVAIGACRAFDSESEAIGPVSIGLASAFLPALLLSTGRGGSTLAAIAERVRQPLAPWGSCCLLGVAVILCGAMRFEGRDEERLDQSLAELETLESLDSLNPGYFKPAESEVLTDRGTKVRCLDSLDPRSAEDHQRIENAFFRERWSRDDVIRQSPGDDRCNCYGWVFTGGRHWIPDAYLETILQENGYREVPKPKSGDLVVYRQNGQAIHLAIVRYTAKARPPMVEGKWGFNGVFLHAVDRSTYGQSFTFHRSPRVGHLLAGIPASADPKIDESAE